MARSSQVLVENNFTKGLITEASAMAFPENAVVESDNCVYSNRGVVTRRLGLDYEDNYVLTPLVDVTANTGAFTEYVWTAVNNNGSTTFLVQQVADQIIFFDIQSDGITPNLKSFSIDLLSYKVAGWTDAQVYTTNCSITSGSGLLFITNTYCEPLSVEYDLDTDTITVTEVVLEIRDFEGLDDGLEVDELPVTLSDAHKYNLYNQGWFADGVTVPAVGDVQVLDRYFAIYAYYPSNAEQWWYYKGATGSYLPGVRVFQISKTEAPKGHYVFPLWNVDRDSIVAGTTNFVSLSRPSAVAFFAGRTFYSGFGDRQLSSSIYFSQLIESTSDVGKCYQDNDPTDESFSEILATDGGQIRIQEADQILSMSASGDALIVLASNGVWSISGTDNTPFTPTNYKVTRLSTIGGIGTLPVTRVDDTSVWVTNEGIFTIQPDQVQGAKVVSITENTVQTLFENIPKDGLKYMKIIYNSVEKVLMFLYRSTEITTYAENFRYDKALILNKVTGAFYPFTFPEGSYPHISGGITCIGINEEGRKTTVFKLLTTGIGGTSDFTYSQFINNSTYKDWVTFTPGGVVAPSYFITGHRIRGELLKKFQTNYLMVLTGDETDGHCLVQGIWDYSNTTTNNRYTSSQDVYRPDSTFNYHRAKVKIRGSGYSLQFKFKSLGNSPFTLIGWSTFETAGNVP